MIGSDRRFRWPQREEKKDRNVNVRQPKEWVQVATVAAAWQRLACRVHGGGDVVRLSRGRTVVLFACSPSGGAQNEVFRLYDQKEFYQLKVARLCFTRATPGHTGRQNANAPRG
jgi:hypothetical protein